MSEPPQKKQKVAAPSTRSPLPLAKPAQLVSSTIDPAVLVGPMKEKLLNEKETREAVYPLAKTLRHTAELTLVQFFSAGDMAQLDASLSIMATQAQALVAQCKPNDPKFAYLLGMSVVQDALSDAQALENLVHFINHGHLATARETQRIGGLVGVKDAVYLNAIIKTCRSLERYAVGRATHGDRTSVAACAEFVEVLLAKLMEFDFRNGPLRRAYDGVKYAHKRLGDVLYETSLCQDVTDNDIQAGKYSKRRRSNVAVIIVRVIFIRLFLFCCLFYNHSFPTNPNSVTNCFQLFSLLQLYNYIAPASLF